jgi:hypothetical protein
MISAKQVKMVARGLVVMLIDLNAMRSAGLSGFPAMIVKPFSLKRGSSAAMIRGRERAV